MRNPEASIIVPVYQAEDYLHKCLDSILHQSFSDFEVILVDDGSTDRSGHICDKYASMDTRFHVFHQKNQGVTAARRAGMGRAQGKYIFWVDADDYVSNQLLEKSLHAAEKSQADVIIWNIESIVNGDSISDRTAWRESSLEQWRENVVKGEYSVLWAGCAKRTLWEKVTFPANRVSAGEDGYLMMDLFFRAESIALVPDVLYYHVDDRQNSISNTRTCRYYFDNYQLWLHRYRFSQNRYPQLVDFCGQRTLSAAVKAYCMDRKLLQLNEDERENLLESLHYFRKHPVTGRTKEKVLCWAICNHYYFICDLYIAHKLKKDM